MTHRGFPRGTPAPEPPMPPASERPAAPAWRGHRVAAWWRAAAAALAAALVPLAAPGGATAARVRIAIVHDNGEAGERTRQGVHDAVAERTPAFPVELIDRRYTSEAQGLQILLEIVDARSADLVIGPTDSGIFVDLAEHSERLAAQGVPIISSLVTASVRNPKDAWRFRTNVDVGLRANEIAEFLSREGVASIVVLHEETEFGKLAEEAFGALTGNGDEYQAYAYRGIRHRQPVRRLLEDRPGAVGVFASQRILIHDVLESLDALNRSWYGYEPLVFSILDARGLCEEGIFFVSLEQLPVGPCTGEQRVLADEAYNLAYDTAVIVLDVAARTISERATRAWSREFRDLFSKMLDGGGAPLGERTGMRFAGRENRAPLGVYTVRAGSVEAVPPARGDRALRLAANWLRERRRRFGLAPAINLGLVAAIVGLLTCFDAARWNSGPALDLVRRHPFRRLIYFNVGSALAVFVALAETEAGPFRWDGLFGAAVVGLGYQGLLKTTILETPSGQRIGLSGIYERWLRRTNEAVMVMRFGMLDQKVGFIAHTNSLPRLRHTLHSIYRRAKTRERRDELVSALAAELDAEPSRIEQKRICAERLLGLMRWPDLQDQRLVPRDIPETELIGPGPILAESQRHCLADRARVEHLEEIVEDCLQSMARADKEHADEERRALEERLRDATTNRGVVYELLAFLFARWNYDLEQIESEGLIPADFREREVERRRRTRRRRRWRRPRAESC